MNSPPVVDDPNANPSALEELAGQSKDLDRKLALHPRAGGALLSRLAQSADKGTRRNVALNPQTPINVLLTLAPTFPGELFQNPVFDLLLLEAPNFLDELPVTVMKNILRRPDCPDSFLNWAASHGSKSHHLALVAREDLTREQLELIAEGSSVKAAEIAASRLLLWSGPER